ncbi:MAG: hypothetical protein M0Z61_12495 [Nitrospiraceae bacterium]|nr:hypothetical protein [Nitrospiraceae bacterium]
MTVNNPIHLLVRFGGSALARVAGGSSAAGEGSVAGKLAMDPQSHAGVEAGEVKGAGVVVSVNGMGPNMTRFTCHKKRARPVGVCPWLLPTFGGEHHRNPQRSYRSISLLTISY